jgi:hypothetical protein
MRISNFSLGIGMPLSHHMIPSAFFDSFISMEKPTSFLYLRTSNGPIEEMRNNLVREALRQNCTSLLMCDTDQVYHPKTITRLLSHKLPIVGVMVNRRYPPFDPLMLKGELGKYQNITEWEPGSLVEVSATGTGCLMFDMQVFRKMPAPWFRRRTHNGLDVGEDIGFCSDLKSAGYKIFVDTSVPAGHLSQMQITESWWRLYRKLSEANAHSVEHGVLVNK